MICFQTPAGKISVEPCHARRLEDQRAEGGRSNPYSDSTAEWKSLQKIIDAHVHLSERQDDALIRFARMNGLRYTLEELEGTMERYGITHGLLLSPPSQATVALPHDKITAL